MPKRFTFSLSNFLKAASSWSDFILFLFSSYLFLTSSFVRFFFASAIFFWNFHTLFLTQISDIFFRNSFPS